MSMRDERGFTLPELIVVAVVAMVLLFIAATRLQPVSYAEANQDAERQLEIAALAQALSHYKHDHGQFPKGLPAKATTIGSTSSSYNLCDVLVPKYRKDLPLDPLDGVVYRDQDPIDSTDAGCQKKDLEYVSGYSIEQKNGEVTLIATSSKSSKLSVTVK